MAYRLSFTEEVPDSVRNCVRQELVSARGLLRERFDDDPVEAVHEARKNIKKTRALLRLVRPGLPKRVYRLENETLRDAGRLISGARDADVMVETVEKLAERYVARIPPGSFELRDQLRVEALAIAAGAGAGAGGGEARAEAAGMLDAVAGRVEGWPLERCDWDTIVAGLERAYRRGREAFACADEDPTVERLHDWRKRVKDIWYHQRLICPAWPDVLGAQAEEAHRLSEILGDDHDLAVLADRCRRDAGARPDAPAHPGPLPPPVDSQAPAAVDPDAARVPVAVAPPPVAVDPDLLLEIIGTRRAELLAGARHLGALVYAERPPAFARRTRRYVERAREAEAEDGLRV